MRPRVAVVLAAACCLVLLLVMLLGDRLLDTGTDVDRIGSGSAPVTAQPRSYPRLGVAKEDDDTDSRATVSAGPTRAVGADGTALGGLGEDPREGEYKGRDHHVIWVSLQDSGEVVSVQPNPDGGFHVRGLDPDAVVALSATRTGLPSTLLVADHPHRVSDLVGRTVTFREAPSAQVRILCRDTLSHPVSARFRVERCMGSERQTVAHVDTGESGTADFVIPGGGQFVVVLESTAVRSNPTFHPLETGFVIDQDNRAEVEVILPSPARLRVVVSDSNDQVVSGSHVNLLFEDEGITREHHQAGPTDATGVRNFSQLVPGNYVVQAIAPGHLPEVRRITLDDEAERLIQIRLTVGGAELSGRLTSDGSALGLPAPGAFLLRRSPRPEETLAFWTVESEGDGGFRAQGLPLGEYELNLLGQYSGIVVRFSIDQAKVDIGTVDVAPARRGGGVAEEIRVTADAPPTMRAKVLFRNEQWDPMLWRSVNMSCSDRSVRLEDLVPGTYRFEVSPAGLDTRTFDTSRAGTSRVVSAAQSPKAIIEIELPRRR